MAAAPAEIRDYRPEDLPAVRRMWREIHWIDDSDRMADALGVFMDLGRVRVGVLDGEVEALSHRTPGAIRYDDVDLPLAAVTGVTTSTVGRNAGLATRLTQEAVVGGALDGAAVAALGMFEQGFYDRVGMGSLGYTHTVRFDPAWLRVPRPSRPVVRVGRDDWAEVADLLARRVRRHGGVRLDPPESARTELAWIEDTYLGLGFRDDAGRLSALAAGRCADEHGPWAVHVCAWASDQDLADLLGLFSTLSAQLHRIEVAEPPGLQLQDLIDRPIRRAEGPTAATSPLITSTSWYQARILDLEACVAARRWPGDPVAFDLVLTDPLRDAGLGWPGLAGEWSVTVGEPSTVVRGHRGGLPVLRAGVGALTRMWFGVRPASGLALTTDLSGPPELLAALDRALCLPAPVVPGLPF